MPRPYVLLSVATSLDGHIDDTSDQRLILSNAEDFDRVYAVNVRGQLLVTKHAVQHMGPGARIVLMSSVSAHKSVYRHALYASSKAAVESLVRQLALELGDRGIAINAIAPGGTETDMAAEVTPNYAPHRYELAPEDALRGMCALGRMARPEEIAFAEKYLNVTGEDAVCEAVLRAGQGSVARYFIAQLQDYLGLGSEGRINVPGTVGDGNWSFRLPEGAFTEELAERIRALTALYGRCPEEPEDLTAAPEADTIATEPVPGK